ANGNRLAADVAAGVGGEKEGGVGNVLRGHGGLQADALDHALEDFVGGDAELLGLGGDDPLDALALDDAGLDAVDAHLVGAGLDREALGEADHGPLGGRVRRAHGEAEAPGNGGQVDDAAAAR